MTGDDRSRRSTGTNEMNGVNDADGVDRKLSDALVAYEPPPPSAGLVDGIMEAVASEASSSAGSPAASRWPLWAAAAALLVVAGGFLLYHVARSDLEAGELRAVERTELALGNRAMATAEAGAALSYEVAADGATRVVQSSGAVRYVVERGGPFIVETPTGVVRVTGTEFRVEVQDMSHTTNTTAGKASLAVGGAVVVTVAVFVGSVLFENEQGQVALAAGDSARSDGRGAPQLLAESGAAAPDSGERAPATSPRKLPSKAARDRLARAIDQARLAREAAVRAERPQQPVGGSSEAPAEGTSDERPQGTLSREYIRDTIREVTPLIRECYELALHEDSNLNGTLRVNFVIIGEEEVGGLVEEAFIEETEGIGANQTLVECLEETIMSLEFPPPEGGGEVRVTYPFRFASSAESSSE